MEQGKTVEDSLQDCKINIAGINILVKNAHNRLLSYCADYCIDFDEPVLTVTASADKRDTVNDEVLGRDFYEENNISIYYNSGEAELVSVLQEMADRMPLLNIFLMHGAAIAKDGQAYLFLALSGTGKTTRLRRWIEMYPDSIVINGDKPFIKVTESDVYVCGSPWCGKEGWNTNTMVPVSSFFLLERADGDERSTIEEISIGEAFPRLLQESHRPNDSFAMRKTILLLKSLDGKVKFYRFRSKPTKEAIQLAYETARLR